MPCSRYARARPSPACHAATPAIGCGGADDRPLHTTQALANDSSALNVLTALNCLTLGGTYRAQTLSVPLCCADLTRPAHTPHRRTGL
jgi:hypothetical protein